MKITLTGASGFIGQRLVKLLQAEGHELTILSRREHEGGGSRQVVWRPEQEDPPAAALEQVDAVIHLAGEPVAQRWTDDVKRRIRSSRVDSTQRLVRALSRGARRPAVLICASAIGIYGSRGDEVLTEASAPGAGFLEDVAVDWEREASRAEELGVRVVQVRIGIVLGGGGGALAKMLPIFKLGVGGPIGSGRQWMSWIHVDDLTALIAFALHHDALRGPVNGTAPQPATNADFTQALGHAVHRPALLPVPEFALRLGYGEMARVLVASQRVLPAAAERAGFQFRFSNLEQALKNVIS